MRLSATSRRKMVACNWLGEPEVTVHYDFDSKKMEASEQRRHDSECVTGRGIKRTTHRVDAARGPVTPLWEWDPSDLEIQVGHKVVWGNETASGHHVTPSGGPWEGRRRDASSDRRQGRLRIR